MIDAEVESELSPDKKAKDAPSWDVFCCFKSFKYPIAFDKQGRSIPCRTT